MPTTNENDNAKWVEDYIAHEFEFNRSAHMKISDSGGKEFEQPPTGTAVARAYRILDLGTQEGEWKGKPIFRRQVHFTWELPTELMSDGDYAGKPFMVSKFYTASLHEKATLRKDLENWRGREFTPEELAGFDPKNVLGKACLLSLTKNEKGKVRVTGVSGLPKGMDVPKQVNESLYFTMDDFSRSDYEALPEYFRELIAKSPEYQKIVGSVSDLQSDTPADLDKDDSIPF